MFCQKEEINHVLGNHKDARDHLVSRFLFIMNEECSSILELNNVLFSQEIYVLTEYLCFICRVGKPSLSGYCPVSGLLSGTMLINPFTEEPFLSIMKQKMDNKLFFK